MSRAAVWIALALIRMYQWAISPLLGSNCRFTPTCSAYAHDAICAHGAGRGILLSAWRIMRCNPWNNGGYDPVPPRRTDPSGAC
ncbi:membrane protein insertion efficiency factor YidD [Ameyamaea chiangmaiensis]|uniref:Putative membrane protein insertion efficiency factor n=1 Tax=Ameyamaea chiangmaiensis TaxID=442969 RepID=A0A850P814_9PROT|nr:membrane protein insertion efficiency factor YidD [Ameyamaea chiangmaiensis]MBS4074430.1 membrane protein insertion efficiency factor YidD [Ameyamaea chiangmaiensis]NVN40755.1 membrane protein insertion efficiency factor YidD [Ameyamaea chiangmaiensis]